MLLSLIAPNKILKFSSVLSGIKLSLIFSCLLAGEDSVLFELNVKLAEVDSSRCRVGRKISSTW